jgi:hypothetical protein
MRLVLFGLALGLVGCMTRMGWHHPTKTKSDFDMEKYQCRTEANQLVPAAMVQRPIPGAYGFIQPEEKTTCQDQGFGRTECTTTPSGPRTTKTVDANEGRREEQYRDCMYARGYYQREEPQ